MTAAPDVLTTIPVQLDAAVFQRLSLSWPTKQMPPHTVSAQA
jgi:hypothetical protein